MASQKFARNSVRALEGNEPEWDEKARTSYFFQHFQHGKKEEKLKNVEGGNWYCKRMSKAAMGLLP